VGRIEGWSLAREPSVLDALAALRADDPASDAELVVGLMGAMPVEPSSIHDVGMATMPGKYIVLRAASRVGEHDAVDRAFDRLSEDDRARVLRERKRHRALAVFLHEVGHCLGALHQADARSLMNRAYDPKMSGFDPGALALMRVVLEGGTPDTVRRRRLARLKGAGSDEWVAQELADEIARLEPPAAVQATPAPAPAPAPPPIDLPQGDHERFDRASALFRAGAVAAAYEAARPLFLAYPESLPVQGLRCQLATVR
jgi:hypothetical protein